MTFEIAFLIVCILDIIAEINNYQGPVIDQEQFTDNYVASLYNSL